MPTARSGPPASTDEFRTFLAADWRAWLEEYPELGTVFGYPGYNDRWTDDSAAGIEGRKRHLARSAAECGAIPASALHGSDRTSYDLYSELLASAQAGLALGDDPLPFRLGMPHNLWMPINQMEGVHAGAADILSLQPAGTAAALSDVVRRIERLPAAFDQNIALLRHGLAAGYSPPRIAIRGVPDQVRGLISDDALQSAYLQPFKESHAGVPPEDATRLTEEAIRAYTHGARPALQRLLDYLVAEYVPACRETVGASLLPSGPAGYAFRVRWQTTTAQTPQEIHEIGLREIARLRGEMEEVRKEAGFAGALAEFFVFLRTDPRFYYERSEDLVNGYKVIAKSIDPGLGRLFGRLPRLPYGILPIPDFRAPSSPTAYYYGGSATTGRPGTFFANTFDLKARPKWEMEALTLHEAVPGHHLQIALTEELDTLPEYRRYTGYTAFIEGWGLYAESLGRELGIYRDPFARMGQLIFDAWRSGRLVVDTGMHALGWSRDQAISYLRDNSGKAELDIANEVDRYIVWPGQALAYKIGQLKFRELRTQAEIALGDRFDPRKFHDMVLAEGGLPLGVLEERFRGWLAAARDASTASAR
ncbi:MAG: DUF885 domain-containing protein [Thermoplasmata archaeon]|nr:DUF885 domain-containing protein [Thermoplasmata archaeon]